MWGIHTLRTHIIHTLYTNMAVVTRPFAGNQNQALTCPQLPPASSKKTINNLFNALPAAEALPHITKLTSLTDLRYPSSWYPLARSMQRTIICHLGPTNSGKTHNALAALASSNSGIYCGPLRLLAWEIATRLNGQGVMCNLITGQEMREIPGNCYCFWVFPVNRYKQPFPILLVLKQKLLSVDKFSTYHLLFINFNSYYFLFSNDSSNRSKACEQHCRDGLHQPQGRRCRHR